MKKSLHIIAILSTMLFLACCSKWNPGRFLASLDDKRNTSLLEEQQQKEIDEFVKICGRTDEGKKIWCVGQKVVDAYDKLPPIANPSQARTRLVIDNVFAWWTRWKMLSNAQESILTTYFILENDVFGKAFLSLLRKKAEDGVNVKLMLDARGTKYYTLGAYWLFGGKDYLEEIVNTGNADVSIFNPKHRKIPGFFLKGDIKSLIASNHDKIIITDKRYTLTGGRNISRNYFVDPNDDPDVFRDTDVLTDEGINAKSSKYSLAGAMTKALNDEFALKTNDGLTKDWINALSKKKEMEFYRLAMDTWMNGGDIDRWWRKSYPEDFENREMNDDNNFDNDYQKRYRTKYIKKLKKCPRLVEHEYEGKIKTYKDFKIFEGDRKATVKIFDKYSMLGKLNQITTAFIKLLDATEKEVIIQNPYVVLTPEVRSALQRANDRGVKIILHTNSPKSTDSLLTQAFFITDVKEMGWKYLLRDMKNVRIYAFVGDNKLHAKVNVFDRKVAMIGTYNMDTMSEQINSEIVAAVKYSPFAMRTALRIVSPIHGDMNPKHSREFTIRIVKDENGEDKIEVVYGPMDTIKDQPRLKRLLFFLKSKLIIKYLLPYI